MTDLITPDTFSGLIARYAGPGRPPAERRALEACERVFDRAGVGSEDPALERRRGAPGEAPIPELARYRDDPNGFGHDIMGVKNAFRELEEVAESVRDNRTTDVQGAHGVGKTHFAGRVIIPWWVYSVGGTFVTSAPGWRQVRRGLWKWIRRGHQAIVRRYGEEAAGRCDMYQLRVNEYQYGYGFAAPKWDPDTALGEHDPLLLLVRDEANAIETTIWDALSSLPTGEQNRDLRLGNPTAPDTPFYRSCQSGDIPGKHKRIKISAWVHPNVKAKRELVPGAITVGWIDQVRVDYGEDSGYFKSRVDAEFPDETEEALIPRAVFEAAIQRYEKDPKAWVPSGPGGVGVDVGERRDRSTYARVRNRRLLERIRSEKPVGDDRDLARAVRTVKEELAQMPKGSWANIDGTGVGAGVASVLIDEKYPANSVKVGMAALTPDKYILLRDELAGTVRERMLKGTIAIIPPRSARDRQELERLKDELAAMHWDRDIHGRFRLEEKKKTKDRLGRSPDSADGFFLGFAQMGSAVRTRIKIPTSGRRDTV